MVNKKIKIFKPGKEHFNEIIGLIKELAEFEKLSSPNAKAIKRLKKDMFKINPPFNILVSSIGDKITGYMFYFFSYSSFLARKTLYLEDIYLSKSYRNLGIGKKFMNELIKIANRNKCKRIEWCVLKWNKNAINFYEKLGARELSEWKYYRFEL